MSEALRQQLHAALNRVPVNRDALKTTYGDVWDIVQLIEEFEVLSYLDPFVVVRRKRDGVLGTVLFQTTPRLYFSFAEDSDAA